MDSWAARERSTVAQAELAKAKGILGIQSKNAEMATQAQRTEQPQTKQAVKPELANFSASVAIQAPQAPVAFPFLASIARAAGVHIRFKDALVNAFGPELSAVENMQQDEFYPQIFAGLVEDVIAWREQCEERAAIMQHDGKLSQADAESAAYSYLLTW